MKLVVNTMDNSPDEIRGVRQRKKHSDRTCCPVCGLTVRPSEIEQHYSLEVERLHKQCHNKPKKQSASLSKEQPGCSSAMDSNDPNDCWDTYQRIKNNRQARLKMKNRKRKADDPVCPVCNDRILEDISVHVDFCLKKSEGGSNGIGSDDESIDVEAESFDEYEWAGQTRIRASSMLDGGYLAAGVGTTIINSSNNDDDEDLNVDGDDTQVYGPSQYSEQDIIVPTASSNKEENENLYLRKLVVGQELNSRLSISQDETMESNTNGDWNDSSQKSQTKSNNVIQKLTNNVNISQESQNQVIESLKEKIREYELQIKNKSKCLICIDEFRIPAVSICCWHVHCEECWLRTLGARKLCPQCNMITSPSDLRRIYM